MSKTSSTRAETLERKLDAVRAENERLRGLLEASEKSRDFLARAREDASRELASSREEQYTLAEHAELLLQNIPTLAFLLDTNLQYIIGSGDSSPLLADSPLGYSGKNLTQCLSPLLDPIWVDELHRRCRQALRSGERDSYGETVLENTGTAYSLQISLSPIPGEDGTIQGLVVCLSDVTELVLAKKAAEDAARTKGDFLASMSHEIRTPMSAITGIAEILLHTGNLDEVTRKYVHDIKSSADSLVTIINDILDLSKLDAGKMTLNPVNFELQKFFDSLKSLAVPLATGKNITFVLETDGEVPEALYADDVRLRQILVNLIGNGIKFTASGRVTLRVYRLGETLRFDVLDTGPGIPPGDQARLFEPFGQANTLQNRHRNGTGLGLSIALRLAKLMGGEIALTDSVPGKGSTFSLTIPMTPGEIKEKETNTDVICVGFSNAARLLIVDDNEVNLAVAAGLLKTLYNLDSDKALSGREALSLSENCQYDIIFMDHMMPDMDGVETTKNLRKMGEWGQNVAIVALTANAVSGAREMLLGAGMNDFLAKPLNRRELERVLIRWLPEKYHLVADADISMNASAAMPKTMGQGRTSSPTSKRVFTQSAIGRMERNVPLPKNDNAPIFYRLEKIPGLDPRNGLGSVFGQEELYLKTLRLLRGKIPGIISQMERLLKADSLDDLAILAHGMKSSLAGIGAYHLSKSARELEAAAREKDAAFCRQECPHFIKLLRELAENLDRVFTPVFDTGDPIATEPVRAAEKGSTAVLRKHLIDMRHALAKGDSGLFSGSLDPLLGLEFGSEVDMLLKLLKQKVDDSDYDGAKAFIDFHFPDA